MSRWAKFEEAPSLGVSTVEIIELVRILRVLFSIALVLALILSVVGLVLDGLRFVYKKLKRPMRDKIRSPKVRALHGPNPC